MKIIDLKVMRGPNYWSVHRYQLILVQLDLEALPLFTPHIIHTLAAKLKQLLPSFQQADPDQQPGLLTDSTPAEVHIAHLFRNIALHLQCQAGIPVDFGQVEATAQKGVYHVIVEYRSEKAGIHAAEAAIQLLNALLTDTKYDPANDIATLRRLWEHEQPGPSTQSILEEAQKRGIPVLSLTNSSLFQLGYGSRQKRISATIGSTTSSLAVDIACSKEDTKQVLQSVSIPVPEGVTVVSEAELKEAVATLGFPLVLKPNGGNQGKGATIGVQSLAEAVQALHHAQHYSTEVVVERFITGFDFRLLVINYTFVAAARRTPAAITGDGQSTIQQLIDQINTDPRRGIGHEKVLTTVKIDEETRHLLQEKKLTLQSVLPAGEKVFLKRTANLSTGGTATDVTEEVHPDTIYMAERIARTVGLDICGIDVMAPTLRTPITQNGGAVLEVNAAPGFRMHLCPAEGKPRNVAAPVVDMLFPNDSKGLLPIVAITGTNGKTTTTRLIAHMAKIAGHCVGYTTTDGVYINDRLVKKGDCTGPQSAESILKDPEVDFAVLECARGGLLRSGLGYRNGCNIGIVTNVSDDHLGLDGIETLEQMAKVKATIPQTVLPTGYAILNADDDLAYGMTAALNCQIALFSIHATNRRIRQHCTDGGLASWIEQGNVWVHQEGKTFQLIRIADIPLTFEGKAHMMIQNLMPAVLTGLIQGFTLEQIRRALLSFHPSPQQTPGRMNVFDFGSFQVMVDYAHNPAAIQALGQFLSSRTQSPKVGVITGVGDRRNKDIIALGKMAAQIFDQLIIKQDKDLRGRKDREVIELIMRGALQINPGIPIKVVPVEKEAVLYALQTAKPGSFTTICCEDVHETLEIVQSYHQSQAQYIAGLGPIQSTASSDPTLPFLADHDPSTWKEFLLPE
jgi:cyanophycin synthetase